MCGLTGIYNYNKKEEGISGILAAMTFSLKHRGPDDSGCLVINQNNWPGIVLKDNYSADSADTGEGFMGLGHRRLSILDLSEAGRQPMSDASGRLQIVFNGEIYNYLELEADLKAFGCVFKTKTDTEVVLQAYLVWGMSCFNRFNGMWSMAIFDQQTGQLILSRDRYGKKPLYYFADESGIVFSSELKALFHHPRVTKKPNLRKWALYAGRNYRNVDTDDETFFEGIRQVSPGSYWVINSDGPLKPSNFWILSPDNRITLPKSELDIIAEFKDLLLNAIQIRLRSDVPVGTMLSGGMDSTTITALARNYSDQIHAFSAVTGEGYYNESEYIQAVVDYTSVKHSYIYPKPIDLIESLRYMLRYHDEPICTITWFSLYLISAEISKTGIKVVLTGHGGDELLAGYWDHYHYYWHDMRAMGLDPKKEIEAWMMNHGRDTMEISREREYVEKNVKNRQLEVMKYANYLDALSPEIRNSYPAPLIECPYPGELNRRMYLELLRETVPPVLRAEDRNMMIHSIENRCPFLDYRLAEFCFSVPENMKIRNGLGKYMLREATREILPETVRTRKDKTGHNLPSDLWWRQEHKQTLLDLFDKTGFVNENVYYMPRVRELFNEHLNGANHSMFFWQYINSHLWWDVNFAESSAN